MVGMLYVRLLESQNKFYGEYDMVKKVMKWVMLVPIKIVEWIMWPIAKVHSWLRQLSDWLHDVMD
tara:strand:+ start:196 stop:390 length:195 start_codon:yes stop_codon:yes gene_type:complete